MIRHPYTIASRVRRLAAIWPVGGPSQRVGEVRLRRMGGGGGVTVRKRMVRLENGWRAEGFWKDGVIKPLSPPKGQLPSPIFDEPEDAIIRRGTDWSFVLSNGATVTRSEFVRQFNKVFDAAERGQGQLWFKRFGPSGIYGDDRHKVQWPTGFLSQYVQRGVRPSDEFINYIMVTKVADGVADERQEFEQLVAKGDGRFRARMSKYNETGGRVEGYWASNAKDTDGEYPFPQPYRTPWSVTIRAPGGR